jgi:hypothetical protein
LSNRFESKSKLIAYCGINCLKCHAYKATRNENNEELEKIAKRWGQNDQTIYTVQDIECKGCNSKLLNKHCYVCEIRACGKEKQLSNCGKCDQFVCDKLRNEWNTWHDANWEEAKNNLEART